MSMRVGITGATGYIGQSLLGMFPKGWRLVSMGRRPATGAGEHRPVDLDSTLGPEVLDGLDAVVHLAANTGAASEEALSREVAFAEHLARAACSRGIPILVLSSQTSSPEAPSAYGRTKAEIERRVLPLGAIVIRPGLVYGGPCAGLFGSLCRFVREQPVIPWLLPSPDVQPVHVRDVAASIIAAIREPHRGRVYRVAGPPLSFPRFLAAIARYRCRCMRIPLPVPVALARGLLRWRERLGGDAAGAARLDSLMRLPPMQAGDDLRDLGITLRDVADGMSKSGTPRASLLREGRALARAIGMRCPSPTLLKRYARALEANGEYSALMLSRALHAWPALLAALDGVAVRRQATKGSLAWRMQLASRLCESDPGLVDHFFARADRPVWRVATDIAVASIRELQARLLYPLAAILGRSL